MLCRVFRERHYKQLQKTFALLSTVPVVWEKRWWGDAVFLWEWSSGNSQTHLWWDLINTELWHLTSSSLMDRCPGTVLLYLHMTPCECVVSIKHGPQVCVAVDRTISAGVTCACWKAASVNDTWPTSRTTFAGASTASQTVCRSGTCWVTVVPARTMLSTLANHTRRRASDESSVGVVTVLSWLMSLQIHPWLA